MALSQMLFRICSCWYNSRYFSVLLSDSLQDILGAEGADFNLEASHFNILYPDIVAASKNFPFEAESGSMDDAWRDLAQHLPSYRTAIHLVDKFHFALGRHILHVPPWHTDNVLLPQFYPSNEPMSAAASRKDDLHDLALLFAVFATGCLQDENLRPFYSEAEWYAHLSRAALSYHGVLEHASLSSVQAVLGLASNTRIVGKSKRNDQAWNLMSFGFHIAASVSDECA